MQSGHLGCYIFAEGGASYGEIYDIIVMGQS